jgi:hypothetical protein
VTEPSKQSGSDPIGDLQRWLVRSGARSVTRQMSGQIRTALGGGKKSTANVWETATTESDESPECPWCPHCRARRLARESGPGLGAGVAAAADAVGVVMRDAMSAFEAAVAAAGQQTKPRDTSAQPRDTTARPSGEVWDEATDEPAVRTRPPANGDARRPSGTRPHPVAPKQSSTGGQQPSSAKQPPAGAKQATGEGKRATGEAKRPSAGAKKPAADHKKPTGRSGGSAAADRTSPDEPTPAKPDEPAD